MTPIYLDTPKELRETAELAEQLSARLTRHALFTQGGEVDGIRGLLRTLADRRS
jgi:hypothetical protein